MAAPESETPRTTLNILIEPALKELAKTLAKGRRADMNVSALIRTLLLEEKARQEAGAPSVEVLLFQRTMMSREVEDLRKRIAQMDTMMDSWLSKDK